MLVNSVSLHVLLVDPEVSYAEFSWIWNTYNMQYHEQLLSEVLMLACHSRQQTQLVYPHFSCVI